jgi:hypothetical protein
MRWFIACALVVLVVAFVVAGVMRGRKGNRDV